MSDTPEKIMRVAASAESGEVAIQTRFHGRDKPEGRATLHIMSGLARHGLLVYNRYVHNEDVDTKYHVYLITGPGRKAVREWTRLGFQRIAGMKHVEE